MQSYFGNTISTALPRNSSSRLSPNTTSPSPPACATGAHSLATITTNTAPTSANGGHKPTPAVDRRASANVAAHRRNRQQDSEGVDHGRSREVKHQLDQAAAPGHNLSTLATRPRQLPRATETTKRGWILTSPRHPSIGVLYAIRGERGTYAATRRTSANPRWLAATRSRLRQGERSHAGARGGRRSGVADENRSALDVRLKPWNQTPGLVPPRASAPPHHQALPARRAHTHALRLARETVLEDWFECAPARRLRHPMSASHPRVPVSRRRPAPRAWGNARAQQPERAIRARSRRLSSDVAPTLQTV